MVCYRYIIVNTLHKGDNKHTKADYADSPEPQAKIHLLTNHKHKHVEGDKNKSHQVTENTNNIITVKIYTVKR